jgi:hypothetical protein
MKERRLAVIMPARRNRLRSGEGGSTRLRHSDGPVCRLGRFTDIVGYTALMGSDKNYQMMYPNYELK